MGFVPSLLGLDGSNGSNFQAVAPFSKEDSDAQNKKVQNAYNQQQAFLNALNGQNGIRNQSSVFNQGQNLANQIQGVVNGTGPNPALAQFQNTTGQNIANQAALMAGQRGAGANAGLLARQVGQQGANIQQQAVGQGAALQAQQQLAAMNTLQNQQNLLGGLSGQQVSQAQMGSGELNKFALQGQQNILNSIDATNRANAGIAGVNAQGQSNLLGGVMGGVAAAALLSHGGMVPKKMADGGVAAPSGPMSYVGKFFQGFGNSFDQGSSSPLQSGISDLISNSVDRFKRTNPGMGAPAAGGGGGFMDMNAAKGAIVPGQAEKKGDSLQNDKVPAMLSPKEIVLPRSITMSPNAPDKARAFVEAVLAKNHMLKGKSK